MRQSLAGTLWRVATFVLVCGVGLVAIVWVFGELRIQPEKTYSAVFTSASGLEGGNFVRIAGVEVGKVKKLTLRDDTTVYVEFSTNDSVVLTEGTKAVIRYQNVVGGRYLALEEGAGGVKPLAPGDTIPLERTAPALDLNALVGGLRPLLRALDPDQVNTLTAELVTAFQGQGPTFSSFLAKTAELTSTLADRDQLIGQVITNLNTLLGTLGDESAQLDEAVDSVAQLVAGLADRKAEVSDGVANLNAVSGSVIDLLSRGRAPLKETVHQLDRAGSILAADHEYLDRLLNGLPDKYQLLARQGLYGDYFSFYLCDALLKVNGKGGQPVYMKVAGQSSGRCTSK